MGRLARTSGGHLVQPPCLKGVQAAQFHVGCVSTYTVPKLWGKALLVLPAGQRDTIPEDVMLFYSIPQVKYYSYLYYL